MLAFGVVSGVLWDWEVAPRKDSDAYADVCAHQCQTEALLELHPFCLLHAGYAFSVAVSFV